ncbi:MAG: protein translocase subunit SecD [Actinomycetota bacterium]|nr:protein translocase subunit SecD [Actinomycetota bacterium]
MKRSSLIMVLATVVISLGAFFAVLALNYKPVLGLDLQGGLSVVYAPAHPVSQATLNETISIISNRVNGLGVAEPNISAQGHNIVVQLPGVKDPQAALKVVGQTATLRFRPVLCSTTAYVAPPKSLHLTAAELKPTCPTTATNSNLLSYVPSTTAQNDTANANVLLPQITNNVVTARYVLGPTLMTGASLKTAIAGLDSTGNWIVQFTLTSKGSPLFDSIARQYYQKNIAIVLDGNVISAPTINSTSFGGHGQISGSFNQSQADNLALVLRYGALPVQLVQQTVQTVSPTLGAASLKAGVFAGLIGLIAVMLYTIFYYRALGVVVVTGLATTAALLWAIISYIGHSSGLTLDLSGVTGLIVSIGVTVDSYIVFFERLKDDVRDGRSIRASIDRSFKKAFRTIVAADLVSFIGALLLYLLSIGPVRGFAFFLGLSTLLDVITSYTFTRPLVILLGRSETFTRARWLGVARGLAVSNV